MVVSNVEHQRTSSRKLGICPHVASEYIGSRSNFVVYHGS